MPPVLIIIITAKLLGEIWNFIFTQSNRYPGNLILFFLLSHAGVKNEPSCSFSHMHRCKRVRLDA